MITIISGTNRSGSVSLSVSRKVLELLTSSEIDAQLLDLQKLPKDFVFKNEVFGDADPGFLAIVDQFVATADQFVFVIPEYNGGFPGVCKAFIDAIKPKNFKGKKAAIIGLSAGRAGNLRGTDQLTGILNYLDVSTVPKPVNILHVASQLNEAGQLEDEHTVEAIMRLLERLLE